jgi:hypothetical protein
MEQAKQLAALLAQYKAKIEILLEKNEVEKSDLR